MENTPAPDTEQPAKTKGEISRELLRELSEKYPVFASRLPLAIGVKTELLAAGYAEERLRLVLYPYTKATRYLKNMAKGGKRYHLDGTEADDLDPEHVEKARIAVAERMKKTIEELRRKKEQKAQEAANRAAKLEQLAKTAANAKKAGKAMPVAQAAAKVAKPAPTAIAPRQTDAVATPAVPVIVKKRRTIEVPK